jgi:hypothetical protein
MMGIDEERLLSATVLKNALGIRPHELDEAMAAQRFMRNIMLEPRLDSGVIRMLEDINRSESLMRAAIGPFADIQRAALISSTSVISRELEMARQAMSAWEARFRLPEIAESARLMSSLQASAVSQALERYTAETLGIQRAMESMRTPWLDTHESLRSLAGFASIQGMGHALSQMPAFGDHLGSALRIDLGDWRDPITWPEQIFTDLGARSDFYVKLGFDTALTTFPSPAFEESLDIAHLRREPPPLIEHYGSPVPASDDDEEEESLVRTNMAHNWLMRFEMQLRKFIDDQMTVTFGRDWPKRKLPNGLHDAWQEKKQAAQLKGRGEQALIAYADFTDYERVICKGDNWNIFEPFFSRKENVRETFQRLYPVRIDTMHSRPITQDDELLLYVETRRLVKVIIGK